jgi:outer membrane lipoprotein carrier protein
MRMLIRFRSNAVILAPRGSHPGGALLRLLRPGTGLAVAFAAFIPASVSSAGADLDAVIAGLQKRYALVESIGADFLQTYRAPGIEQTESGTLIMKKPGFMRWEYRAPEFKLFIADGRETYLYIPEDRQVLIRRFSAAELHSTPLQFLLGQGDTRQSFEVAWEQDPGPNTRGAFVLRFTPRAAEADYAYVVIECDARSFDMRRIVIRERTGNTSDFALSNLKTNIKVDGRQFQFKLPKGVEVVRLDEK